jgi:hypothetical protein
MPDSAAGFQAGDRVATPGRNLATVLLKPWVLPLVSNYEGLLLSSGVIFFVFVCLTRGVPDVF